ncbi:MAG: class I SAM-dependent methyltransferase, partial [Promethearchaeota archaeon]
MSDEYRFDVKKKRPEEKYPDVRDYYKGKTLSDYAMSKSKMRIQEKITRRSLDLLELKEGSLILDAGCGPGFSSILLKEMGYKTVALDLISDFLYFYELREVNPIVADMTLIPLRDGIFDGIISISALQWVFRDLNDNSMRNSMINLVKSFERVLKPAGKIVIQFYPKNDSLMTEVGKIFNDYTNLNGNFLIDNPDSPKKRRIFLLL